MSKSLKLKSAEESERLLKSLADDLFHAKIHHTILCEIGRLAKNHQAEMGYSPVFWQYTFRAHSDMTLMRVFRIYDQHPSGFHLLRLLRTVEGNDWLFSKEAFMSRVTNQEHAESLYEGIPEKKQLEADIHFVSESNPRIKKLKKWRDEIVFHKNPRYLLSGRAFESDNPLPYAEVSNLIEEGARLVNRYSSHFNAVHYGNDTNGWKDVEFIFQALTHHPYVVELRADQK